MSVETYVQRIFLRQSWQSRLVKRSRQRRSTFSLGSHVHEAFAGFAFAASEAVEKMS